MALFGKSDTANNAPKGDVNSAGQTGIQQYGNTVFGLTTTESKLLPGTNPGWVRIVNGTGGRAGRKQIETLVAIRRFGSGDASVSTVPVINANALANASQMSIASQGTYSASPSARTYQWFFNSSNTNVGGTSIQTGSTFTPGVSHVGKFIFVVETATFTGNVYATATSLPVGPVAA